jgi:hypothetical protein
MSEVYNHFLAAFKPFFICCSCIFIIPFMCCIFLIIEKAYPLLLDLGLLLDLVSAVHHLLFGDVFHHAVPLILGLLGIAEASSGLLLRGLAPTLLLRVANGFLGEVLQVGVATIVLLRVLLIVPWDVSPLSWLLLLLVLVGVHRLGDRCDESWLAHLLLQLRRVVVLGPGLVAIHATDTDLPDEATRISLWRRRKIVNGRFHVILPDISHWIGSTVTSVFPN